MGNPKSHNTTTDKRTRQHARTHARKHAHTHTLARALIHTRTYILRTRTHARTDESTVTHAHKHMPVHVCTQVHMYMPARRPAGLHARFQSEALSVAVCVSLSFTSFPLLLHIESDSVTFPGPLATRADAWLAIARPVAYVRAQLPLPPSTGSASTAHVRHCGLCTSTAPSPSLYRQC